MTEQRARRMQDDFIPAEGVYRGVIRGVYGFDDKKGRPRCSIKVRFTDERFPAYEGKEAFWNGWLHTPAARRFTFGVMAELLDSVDRGFDPEAEDVAEVFASKVADGSFLDVECVTTWQAEQWNDGSVHITCRWINPVRPDGPVSKKHGEFFAGVAERLRLGGQGANLGGDTSVEDSDVPF